MLSLTRKVGQSIVISHPDGEITVVVFEVRGVQVRLGVKAPPTVSVDREEIAALKAEHRIGGQ